MRLAVKDAFLLLVVYLVASAALIWGAHEALDRAADSVMEETARLVGREVVSAVTAPLLDELVRPRRGGGDRLDGLVRKLADRSETVETATLVDVDGTVLASTDPADATQVFPSAEDLFGEDPRTRLVNRPSATLQLARYFMDIPLKRDGETVAYLHLTLDSLEIGQLYRDARGNLFAGFVISAGLIGLLGFLLHTQLRRRDEILADSLQEVLEGRELSPRIETETQQFRTALATARRLGEELHTHRERDAKTRRRLTQIAQVMDVGVVLVDDRRRLETASERARDLLAPGAGPALEQRWADLAEEWSELFDRAAASQDCCECDVEANGDRPSLRLVIHRTGENGDSGFLVLIRDAQTANALERDLQLAAQFRGLGGLFMGVAHDFRASINAVVLNIELLKRALPSSDDDGDDARQRHRFEVIEDEIHRLQRSVERLLAHTVPARPSAVRYDLTQVVSEVADFLAPQARQQKVELDVKVPDERLLTHGSPEVTKQALINVAVNGFEALGDGGHLSIEALPAVNGDGHAIRIADDGPGIVPEIRDRIFELHFTTKETGTGVGLYATRAMMEAQGGSLRLANSGPAGTTFELRLPAADAAAAKP